MRRSLLLTFAVLAALTVTAALAWACTPQAYINLSTASGQAGDTVTVTGRGFVAGPVEIHWNGARGPLLATATGPDFSVEVTIPASAPGVYYPHAVARAPGSADGTVVGDAQRAFEVVGAPSAAPRAPASTPAPAPRSAPAPAGDAPAPRQQGARRADSSRGDAPAPRLGAAGAPAGDRTGAQARRAQPGAGPSPGASRRSASAAAQAAGAARDQARQPLAASPSQLAASSDPWSGVAAADAPTLLAGGTDAKATGAGAGASGRAAIGLALLAIGMATLLAAIPSARVR